MAQYSDSNYKYADGELSYDGVFHLKILTISEVSVPNLEKIMNYFRSLAVVESSIAILSKISSYFKNLAAMEISIPTMNLIKTFYQILSAVENSIASLTKALPKAITMSVTEISVTVLEKLKFLRYASKQFILKSIYYAGSKIMQLLGMSFSIKNAVRNFTLKGFGTSYILKNKIKDETIKNKL